MVIDHRYAILGKFSKACRETDINISMRGMDWQEISGFEGYEINKKGQIIDYLGQLVYPNEDGDVFLYKLEEGKRKRVKRRLDNLIADVFTPPKKIKQVLVKDLEGNLIGVYPNRYQAGKAVGVSSSQVGCVVNGVAKSSKGFVFQEIVVEDTEE